MTEVTLELPPPTPFLRLGTRPSGCRRSTPSTMPISAPALDGRAGRGAGQYRGHRGESRGADIRQHDRGAGTGGRDARPGGGGVLQPRGIGVQPRAGGVAAGVRAEVFSAYSSEITNNAKLFARIAELWERREELGLTEEQMRVLYLTHRSFVRAGAALDGAARERLTEVKSRLAVLGTSFTQNLLADEREWFMELAEADLEGLPDFVVAAARAAGEEKGAGGPVVTLSRSLIVPFLQFSPRRDLRERR
jgi:hypothetical protein